MRHVFITVLVLLILPSSAVGDCRIAVKNQVPNPGLCCAWACLETVGKHLHHSEFNGLAAWYFRHGSTGASIDNLDDQLKIFQVQFSKTSHGTIRQLRKIAEAGQPAIIDFIGESPLGPHACIMKNVTDTHVYFYNPNHPGCVFRYKLPDFLRYWGGWIVTVEPKAE